jgi:hypothetical protein
MNILVLWRPAHVKGLFTLEWVRIIGAVMLNSGNIAGGF